MFLSWCLGPITLTMSAYSTWSAKLHTHIHTHTHTYRVWHKLLLSCRVLWLFGYRVCRALWLCLVSDTPLHLTDTLTATSCRHREFLHKWWIHTTHTHAHTQRKTHTLTHQMWRHAWANTRKEHFDNFLMPGYSWSFTTCHLCVVCSAPVCVWCCVLCTQ